MPPPTHDTGALKREHWDRARSTVDALAGRGIQDYVGSLPYVGGAFRLTDRVIRCIDGRLRGGLRLAGSGILLGQEGARKFAEAAGAAGVTYHRDCGAARLWAQQAGLPEDDAADRGRAFAEALAAKLGVPCSEAALEGVEGFHDEMVIYYDGTGSFDPWGVRLLPKGFVIHRKHLDFAPTYVVSEAEIAVAIALGEHGFGELFTPQTPLRLVPIGTDRAQVASLAGELQPLAAKHAGRVVVDGLVAPFGL